MLSIEYADQVETRERIRAFVHGQRQTNPNFRVIDVGGVAGGGSWTDGWVDMIVDLNAGGDSEKTIKADINSPQCWQRLKDHVALHGKFDYAICTHTLEDVYNPMLALEQFPSIAQAGIISTPSITTEMSRDREGNWLGYHHHRWIFDHEDGHLLIAGKLNFLEKLYDQGVSYVGRRYQINYDWQDELPVRALLDNYSPSLSAMQDGYRGMIDRAVNQITALG
jgi:hypothetical protein